MGVRVNLNRYNNLELATYLCLMRKKKLTHRLRLGGFYHVE